MLHIKYTVSLKSVNFFKRKVLPSLFLPSLFVQSPLNASSSQIPLHENNITQNFTENYTFLEDPTTGPSCQKNSNSQHALDFISSGIGCFALALIDSVGIVSSLMRDGYFNEEELSNQEKYKKPLAVKSALLSLCLCKVLTKNHGFYSFTELGNQLAKHIGLVTMSFDGYGQLMAKGVPIASGEVHDPDKYSNRSAIALSSIQFREKVDPIMIGTIKELQLKGTICDLGCGSGELLLKICRDTSLPGLGLDLSEDVVEIAKNKTANFPSISIEKGDATDLQGAWEDVQVLIQTFMTHNIFPDEKFIDSLSAYRRNFPNLKYFLVVDIVAPEDNFASYMPAYDYIHGLLGVETRQYDRFTSLFTKAGYTISKTIAIDMPNTYFWILRPIDPQ